MYETELLFIAVNCQKNTCIKEHSYKKQWQGKPYCRIIIVKNRFQIPELNKVHYLLFLVLQRKQILFLNVYHLNSHHGLKNQLFINLKLNTERNIYERNIII